MGIDHLFSKRKTTGDRPRGSSTFADPRAGAGVYVDMENLRDDVLRDGTKRTSTSQETIRRKEIVRGQQVIRTLLDTWPQGAPKPQRLSLYVRADLVEVWRLSSVDQFPCLEVEVRGVQHFSSSAKNTADIALAADAIADLVLGRVGYVAVVSDDSDFISLYAKVREEMERANSEIRVVPFLWVVTDRPRTVSASVRDYFPDRHLHVIHWEENGRQSPGIDPVANVPRTAASPHRPAAAPRPVAPAPPAGRYSPADSPRSHSGTSGLAGGGLRAPSGRGGSPGRVGDLGRDGPDYRKGDAGGQLQKRRLSGDHPETLARPSPYDRQRPPSGQRVQEDGVAPAGEMGRQGGSRPEAPPLLHDRRGQGGRSRC